jgi:hypothetical protein
MEFNPQTLQSTATDKILKIRYNEHIRYTRSHNPQVAYAVDILNNCHEYGLVDEIMELETSFTG